jgi:hypothetical protein
MTSLNLKKMMNLPRKHQKNVHVVDKSRYVSSVSDEKAAALSQAATRMKVDTARKPSEPLEINGELVSAMGELKDVLVGDEKVQGRNYYDVNEQVSQPVTTNIVVMYGVVKKYVAVKCAVVEDMLGTPLSLTWDSVTEDRSVHNDKKLEEVLAELEMRLEGLSSYQAAEEYEVAEWSSMDKEHIMKAGLKKDKLEREKSWKIQMSRIYQPLSWGCFGWQQVPPNRLLIL